MCEELPTFYIANLLACSAGIEEDMPDFNLDDLIQEAEAEFEPLIAESKEMAAQADKEIQKLEKELQTLDQLQVILCSFPSQTSLLNAICEQFLLLLAQGPQFYCGWQSLKQISPTVCRPT